MGAKFQVGDRIRVNEELFPSFNEGLFNSLPKTGTVVRAEPASILPYQAKLDGLEHHPFWFYENQLLFEDAVKEKAWAEANKPKLRTPGAKPAPAPAHEGHA
jgi:hypothetical protein